MIDGADTPAARGFRMPAEWEPHAATWLSWPNATGASFPSAAHVEAVIPEMLEIVRLLARAELVFVNVRSAEEIAVIRDGLTAAERAGLRFFEIPTREPWCRDHGPTFLADAEGSIAAVNWEFNSWGGKYPPFDEDNAAGNRMAEAIGVPAFTPGIVFEGGGLEVNGSGTLITTSNCICDPARNPGLEQVHAEEILKAHLGVSHVIWLEGGVEGDDTSHVDVVTRFVRRDTVVTVVEEDESATDYAVLLENFERLRMATDERGMPLQVVALPAAKPIWNDELNIWLPAGYANFYVANQCVLVPVYGDAADGRALEILSALFPGREVAPVRARELVFGQGSIHCLTQQVPAGRGISGLPT